MKTKPTELDAVLFRQTFSKVTPSPEFVEEVIHMTEMQSKPKKVILRRLAVAALVLALAVAVAMGANAATNGELFKPIITLVTSNEDGTITLKVDANAEDMPEGGTCFTIKEDWDGKGVLTYQDKDGNYIEEEVDLANDVCKEMEKDSTALYDVEGEPRRAAESK